MILIIPFLSLVQGLDLYFEIVLVKPNLSNCPNQDYGKGIDRKSLCKTKILFFFLTQNQMSRRPNR